MGLTLAGVLGLGRYVQNSEQDSARCCIHADDGRHRASKTSDVCFVVLCCAVSSCVPHARGEGVDADQQGIPQCLIVRVSAQALEDLHLHDVGLVDEGVAHQDEAPQGGVALTEVLVPRQLQAGKEQV